MSERLEKVKNPVSVVQQWLDNAVIGLNLCPFAATPKRLNKIHYRVLEEGPEDSILQALMEEMQRLDKFPDIETTLLILPHHLQSFDDYNQFLNWTDALINKQGWSGIYQIASFHPDYCFQGAAPDDVENWTNRSPYPLLHLIREERLEAILDRFPDAENIPDQNMATLRRLTEEQQQAIFPHLFAQ